MFLNFQFTEYQAFSRSASYKSLVSWDKHKHEDVCIKQERNGPRESQILKFSEKVYLFISLFPILPALLGLGAVLDRCWVDQIIG